MRSEFIYGGYRVSSIADGYIARPSDAHEESGFDIESGEFVASIFEMTSSRIQVLIEAIDMMDEAVLHGGDAPIFFKTWMKNGSNGRIDLDTYTKTNREELYRGMLHDIADRFNLALRVEITADSCPIDGERVVYEIYEVASDDGVYRRMTLPPYGKDCSCKSIWEAAYRSLSLKFNVVALSDDSR